MGSEGSARGLCTPHPAPVAQQSQALIPFGIYKRRVMRDSRAAVSPPIQTASCLQRSHFTRAPVTSTIWSHPGTHQMLLDYG